MDKTKNPGILVHQIFLDSASFSHRGDYLSLPPSTPPFVGQVSINGSIGEREDGKAGLVRIDVRTDPAQNPIYNVQVAVIALVEVEQHNENMSLSEYLVSPGSLSLVYPFVREAFANITLRGRFGAVWLNLINLREMAEQLKAAMAGTGTTVAASEIPHALNTSVRDPAAQQSDALATPGDAKFGLEEAPPSPARKRRRK